ncbi:MAG: cyclic pyranopterin phosphate synthase [Myxococcota bacterium]|jgi:cyclic pyranopterin phosphate synthase
MDAALDLLNRPQHALRLSVIDRCNFRCEYCMPQDTYQWLPKEDILSLEEMVRLSQVFIKAGGRKIRLTGGEPLLRKNLKFLVAELAAIEGLEDLALTTNAFLLEQQAQELRSAGLQRINISLDTLRQQRFKEMCKIDGLKQTLAGIDAAIAVQFDSIKLDMVVLRDKNSDELVDMLEYAQSHKIQLRYIEYMDVGGALDWSSEQLMPAAEMLEILSAHFGKIVAIENPLASAPAKLYRLENGYEFGIIASMSSAFCADCDRSRVTADGNWYSCLYATSGHKLRDTIRHGSEQELTKMLRELWLVRDSQEAVLRAELPQRQPAMNLDDLLADPHLEMHTRGG